SLDGDGEAAWLVLAGLGATLGWRGLPASACKPKYPPTPAAASNTKTRPVTNTHETRLGVAGAGCASASVCAVGGGSEKLKLSCHAASLRGSRSNTRCTRILASEVFPRRCAFSAVFSNLAAQSWLSSISSESGPVLCRALLGT